MAGCVARPDGVRRRHRRSSPRSGSSRPRAAGRGRRRRRSCWRMTVSASRIRRSVASRRSASISDTVEVSSQRRYADATPTRSAPCRRATSSTRYSSGCGTGVRDRECRVASTSLAERPASRRATQRGVAEAVDRRAAGGLDVGEQRHLAGEVALERPGRDRREIGLQQHVVEQARQQRLERVDDVAGTGVRPGIRVAARASAEDSSADVDSSSARPWVDSAPRPVTPMRSASSGVASTTVHHSGDVRRGRRQRSRLEHRRVRRRLPGLERDELVEQRATGLGCERAVDVASERVDARAGVVATRHEHGRAGHEQPGLGEQRPPLGDRARAPRVERRGRAPHLVDLAVGGEKPCGVSDLDDERRALLVEVERRGGAREVAHREPAAAQDDGRCDRPRLEQVLDQANERERLLARRAVDEVRRAVACARRPAARARTSRTSAPSRSASATSRGTTTVSGAVGSSRWCASSHSSGVRAVATSTGRSAPSTRPTGGPHTSRSSASRAPSGASASTRSTREGSSA